MKVFAFVRAIVNRVVPSAERVGGERPMGSGRTDHSNVLREAWVHHRPIHEAAAFWSQGLGSHRCSDLLGAW